MIEIDRLEHSPIPVHVVAADLQTGEPVVISRGGVLPALLASTAIPGLFPPVEFAGPTLIDGGVAADTPVAEAESLGATTIYVLPTYGADRLAARPRSVSAVGLRAMGQLLGHAGADKIASARHATVHLLPVPPTSEISPFDIARSARLIDQAARLATSWLENDRATQPSQDRWVAASVERCRPGHVAARSHVGAVEASHYLLGGAMP